MNRLVALRRSVVLVVALVSVAPIANWIPGGREYPAYAREAGGWLTGLLIVVGGSILLTILGRRVTGLWRDGAAGRMLSSADPAISSRLAVVAVLGLALYLAVALMTFDGRPLLIDEIVQALQARMYRAGRLWLPAGSDPALTSVMHLVERDGKVFGHFPPGGPGWLLLGELLRAPWVAVPVAGALAIVAWGAVLRRIEPRASVRGAALLLFAAAPFTMFMAGSHMNHVPTLMWLLVAAAALLRWIDQPERLGAAALTGLAFGLAAITRPADALGWGIPAGIWLLARVRTDRRVVGGILLAVGAGLLPLALGGWVNLATTGGVLRSGYQELWGPNVGLGFHPAPFGPDHTVVRGVELVGLYLLRLNVYLFEAPLPSLVPALGALWLARRLEAADRFLLAGPALVLVLYWAYWFDGFYLGPRFVFTAAPVAALWTARLPGLVRERFGAGRAFRSVCYGGGIAAVLALGLGVPYRAAVYGRGLQSMRWDVDRAAEQAGVADAVVLVRESWGAQVLARLWALGVSRSDAEHAYRNTDTCILAGEVAGLEGARRDSAAVMIRLAAVQADSARLVDSPLSPDSTERVLDGASYPAECVTRINEDRAGFFLYPPLLLSRRSDLYFVRDLQGRSGAALRAFPGRGVYLLYRATGDSVPRFHPVSRDSILSLPR